MAAMFRHETGSCYFAPHGQIVIKRPMFDDSPSLNTFTCQGLVIVIAPPTDNGKLALCDSYHLIYSKFSCCGLHMTMTC